MENIKNKRYFGALILTLSVLFNSCTGGSMATQQDFDNVIIGSPIAQFQERMGAPYEIERQEDGKEIYHYIEKIEIGPNATAQNDYALTVSEGIVVDKKCNSYSPALVQIRSP